MAPLVSVPVLPRMLSARRGRQRAFGGFFFSPPPPLFITVFPWVWGGVHDWASFYRLRPQVVSLHAPFGSLFQATRPRLCVADSRAYSLSVFTRYLNIAARRDPPVISSPTMTPLPFPWPVRQPFLAIGLDREDVRGVTIFHVELPEVGFFMLSDFFSTRPSWSITSRQAIHSSPRTLFGRARIPPSKLSPPGLLGAPPGTRSLSVCS